MATWTYLGGALGTVVTSGACTVTLPTFTPQEGDLVVAVIGYRDTAAFTAPTGWTIIEQQSSGNVVVNTTGSIASGLMAYCIAGSGGSLPASNVFSRTGGDAARSVCSAYRSSVAGSPTLGPSSSATAAAASTTVSTAGLTTTDADALLAVGYCGGINTGMSALAAATDPTTASGVASTANPGSAWLERQDGGTTNGADMRAANGDAVKATAGSTGTISCTGGNCRNVLIAAAFYHPSAGGGAVTGTLAATETGSDTASLSGAVEVAGTLSATEAGSDTAAITGTVAVSGSLSATEAGADTAALAGTVTDGASGILSATETGSDTASLSGTVAISGSLAATETGSDTATLTGTVAVSGALDATETGSDTASLSGAVTSGVSGVLAATETGGDTASILGTVEGGEVVTRPSGADPKFSGGRGKARAVVLDPRTSLERLAASYMRRFAAPETPKAEPRPIAPKALQKAATEARKALPAVEEIAPALAIDWQALIAEMEAATQAQAARQQQIAVMRQAVEMAERLQREIDDEEEALTLLFAA